MLMLFMESWRKKKLTQELFRANFICIVVHKTYSKHLFYLLSMWIQFSAEALMSAMEAAAKEGKVCCMSTAQLLLWKVSNIKKRRNIDFSIQKHIQNPLKHLKYSILQKCFGANWTSILALNKSNIEFHKQYLNFQSINRT